MLNLLFVQAAACAAPRTIGRKLPAIVSERLVGFRHFVGIFTLLHGRTSIVAGVHNLGRHIGGGIGQSRLCMLLLGSAHIGEVQASVWDAATREACEKAGIPLL